MKFGRKNDKKKSDEPDLFAWVNTTLVRSTDPNTSREAAFTLDPETGNWRVAFCLYHNEPGLTCDEMDDLYAGFGWTNHDGEPHKRVDTLRKVGWVEDSGLVRPSKKTRRNQIVWVMTEKGRLKMSQVLSR